MKKPSEIDIPSLLITEIDVKGLPMKPRNIVRYLDSHGKNLKTDAVNIVIANSDSEEDVLVNLRDVILIRAAIQDGFGFAVMRQSDPSGINPENVEHPMGFLKEEDFQDIIALTSERLSDPEVDTIEKAITALTEIDQNWAGFLLSLHMVLENSLSGEDEM